jgi:hypothetical protein
MRRLRTLVVILLAGLVLTWVAAGATHTPAVEAEQFGPDDFRISYSGPDGDRASGAQMPAVAYNPDAGEYFSVWVAITQTTTVTTTVRRAEILGQRLNAVTGARLGGPIQISPPPDNALQESSAGVPAVVYNPVERRYLVVWGRRPVSTGASSLLLSRFVDAVSGAPLGTTANLLDLGVSISDDVFSDEDRIGVAYSSVSNRYLVVYSTRDKNGAYTISGLNLTPDGLPSGSILRIQATLPNGVPAVANVTPSVAYNPQSDDFLVVWLAAPVWFLFERELAFVYAQRVNARTGQLAGQPVLIAGSDSTRLPPGLTPAPLPAPSADEIQVTATPIPIAASPRPGLPVVAHYLGLNAYLVAWVEGRGYDANYGPVRGRWVQASGDPADDAFLLPVPDGCGAGYLAVSPVSSPVTTLGIAYSTAKMGGTTDCPAGSQIFAVWLRGFQRRGFGRPDPISQMGPVGGARFRAIRPAVAMGASPAESLIVWSANDEAPGLDPDKVEVYGQQASSLNDRLLLANVQRDFRPQFGGTAEVEPNNTAAAANGPLVSARPVIGFQNDDKDYFRLTTTQTGPIVVELSGTSATGTQLQLLTESLTRVGYDADAPYRIELPNAAPGTYFAYLVTGGAFNSTVPYTLRVTFP